MPDIDGGEYLVSNWTDCGLFCVGMGGIEPLSWSEINSYSDNVGGLDGWERKQIRKMSEAFVSFKAKADNMGCPAPFRVEMTDEDRRKQADSLKSVMMKLKSM